jgi:hypothetical protein
MKFKKSVRTRRPAMTATIEPSEPENATGAGRSRKTRS